MGADVHVSGVSFGVVWFVCVFSLCVCVFRWWCVCAVLCVWGLCEARACSSIHKCVSHVLFLCLRFPPYVWGLCSICGMHCVCVLIQRPSFSPCVGLFRALFITSP